MSADMTDTTPGTQLMTPDQVIDAMVARFCISGAEAKLLRTAFDVIACHARGEGTVAGIHLFAERAAKIIGGKEATP